MNIEGVNKYLNAFHRRFGMSGVVLAAIGEDVIYNKCWGYADIEHRIRNVLCTKFMIGSMTKQFTAFAVLMLKSEMSEEDWEVVSVINSWLTDGDSAHDRIVARVRRSQSASALNDAIPFTFAENSA